MRERKRIHLAGYWKNGTYDSERKRQKLTHTHTDKRMLSSVQLCPTLCDPIKLSTPGLPVHHQLPEFAQTHVHRVSDAINYLILCHPLLLPSIFPSIRVFSNESAFPIR